MTQCFDIKSALVAADEYLDKAKKEINYAVEVIKVFDEEDGIKEACEVMDDVLSSLENALMYLS